MGNPLKDETGNTYGYLTVLGFNAFDKRGQARWRCWCSKCERELIILGGNLRKAIAGTKGCSGCRGVRRRSPETKFYHAYKHGALQRGLSFEITMEQFGKLISSNCHYCGCEPSLNVPIKYIANCRYNGVDRLDSAIGYLSNNCVPCCSICNYAKRKMSKSEFLAWVKRVYLFQRTLADEGSLQEFVCRPGGGRSESQTAGDGYFIGV